MKRNLAFKLVLITTVLTLRLSPAFGQTKVKLDSTIRFLEYYVGNWTAMPRAGNIALFSEHTIEPILGGKFLRRSVVQGFNGKELLHYTEETMGWNTVKKQVDVTSQNAPGFVFYGEMAAKDAKTIERTWTLYDAQGVELEGKDIWEIQDDNSFKWSQFFLRDNEWKEVPYSPFMVYRSLGG